MKKGWVAMPGAEEKRWPTAGDVGISKDGSLTLRKGKSELRVEAHEVTGLFELLALALPPGPEKVRAQSLRRARLAHEFAIELCKRAADLSAETLHLLEASRALEDESHEEAAPAPTVEAARDARR